MLVEAFKQRRLEESPKEEPKKRGLSWVTRPTSKTTTQVGSVFDCTQNVEKDYTSFIKKIQRT